MSRSFSILLAGLFLSGCGLPIGARAVLPPDASIKAGMLYSSAQDYRRPGPVSLDILCETSERIRKTIAIQPSGYYDEFDITYSLSEDYQISGIQAASLGLGLSGKLVDYYDLKLKKAWKYQVSSEKAEDAFGLFMQRNGCRRAYAGDKRDKYIYQVRTIYIGDVTLSVKQNLLFSADLVAKLKALEPKAKAQFKKASNLTFTGQQMVGAVDLIPR